MEVVTDNDMEKWYLTKSRNLKNTTKMTMMGRFTTMLKIKINQVTSRVEFYGRNVAGTKFNDVIRRSQLLQQEFNAVQFVY